MKKREPRKQMDPRTVAKIKLIMGILSIVAFIVAFILGYMYG